MIFPNMIDFRIVYKLSLQSLSLGNVLVIFDRNVWGMLKDYVADKVNNFGIKVALTSRTFISAPRIPRKDLILIRVGGDHLCTPNT